ncbi:MAG: DUF2283 domain-containing protein [Cyanobacteria bacterium P01_H01_bin.121]
MKLIYDEDFDILQLTLSDRPVAETAQIAPNLILDYDDDAKVVGVEFRKASQWIDEPTAMGFVIDRANLDKPQPRRAM